MEIRNFYVKAYIGELPKNSPKFWLVFKVLVPPLGWNTYFISKATKEGRFHGTSVEEFRLSTDHHSFFFFLSIVTVMIVYLILFLTEGSNSNCYNSAISVPHNETIEIGSGSLKVSFSSTSGKLNRVVNYRTGVSGFMNFKCYLS